MSAKTCAVVFSVALRCWLKAATTRWTDADVAAFPVMSSPSAVRLADSSSCSSCSTFSVASRSNLLATNLCSCSITASLPLSSSACNEASRSSPFLHSVTMCDDEALLLTLSCLFIRSARVTLIAVVAASCAFPAFTQAFFMSSDASEFKPGDAAASEQQFVASTAALTRVSTSDTLLATSRFTRMLFRSAIPFLPSESVFVALSKRA
mmetsp:Transcript_3115/g.9051  ORF Transcript_3115/g.9051 Transcript_3115/m.9051 type:complete len:208 (-) Transcript_3115:3100-3723(-)